MVINFGIFYKNKIIRRKTFVYSTYIINIYGKEVFSVYSFCDEYGFMILHLTPF